MRYETPEPAVSAEAAGRFLVQYLHSAPYDLVFFLTPFWASLLYVALISAFPAHQAAIFILSYILLAETHFASTWILYLDPLNRKHFANRPIVYYVAPLLVIASSVLLAWRTDLKVVMFLGSLISALHVTRQSTGVVALYRGRARQIEAPRRRWENLLIYLGSGTFLGVGFLRFYASPVGEFAFVSGLIRPLVPLMKAGVVVVAIMAFFCLGRVVALEIESYVSGGIVSVSKLMVLAYSILLYSPYVFASRIEHAVAIGVGVHYVQYLGIVWLLTGNKYRATVSRAEGATSRGFGQRILVELSQSVWLRLSYLGAYACVMALLRQGGFRWDSFTPASWLYSIAIGFQIVHYHIDAYVWRFSDPYIRTTVLPYLKKM